MLDRRRRRRFESPAIFFISTAALLAAACGSPGRKAAWEIENGTGSAQPTTSTTTLSSLVAEAEEHWSKRDAKDEVERAIATWEKILESDAHNADVLARLSRASFFLADAHIALESGDHDDRELETYQKGVDYGERALIVVEPEFGRAMRDGAEFAEAIIAIGEKGVPAAYWYCVNLGRFATKKGLSTRVYYKDRLEAAMKRVLELAPAFFYAAADRFLGSFYAAVPSVYGKDLRASEKYFQKARERAPEYLWTRVAEAQFLAFEMDDRERYRELLNQVLEAPDTDNPDIAPENRAAKRTAKKMLAEMDDRF